MPLSVNELQEGTGSISGDAGGNASPIMAGLKAYLKIKPSATLDRVGIRVWAVALSTLPPKDPTELPVVILVLLSLPRPCSLPRAPNPASHGTSLCSPVWDGSYSSKREEACVPQLKGKGCGKLN